MSSNHVLIFDLKIAGVYGVEVPPVPIPNTEVKLFSVDDTWLATTWEIISMPAFIRSSDCQMVFFSILLRRTIVGTLGNILWFLFGGLFSGLSWILCGILWCITIIGIPIGKQCFKFADVAFFPFGKEINYGGGAVSLIANIFWLLLSGIWMALGYVIMGLILCVTIIGIPFGLQMFKLAKLSLMPFGATITYK